MFSKLSLSITKILDKNIKKNQGIYFTPPSTIIHNIDLLKYHLNFDNITSILEPSCGSCEYVIKLNNLFDNLHFTCIENNPIVYNNIKFLQNDNINIINQDFLHFNDNKKYQLIIGNPPYFVISKNLVDKYYFDYFDGRPNIFILFIIKSLNLLDKNGILSFILPKNFTNSQYYNKTRKYLVNNYEILFIVNCNDNYLETKQDTIILCVKNIKPHNNSDFYLSINDNIIIGSKNDIKSIKLLYHNSKTLKSLGFKVYIGNIVWNQVKNILTDDIHKTKLIYSSDIDNNNLIIKKYNNPLKKNFINKKGFDKSLLIVNRGYGTGKYNFNYSIIDYNIINEYLIENHLLIVEYSSYINNDNLLILYNKIIKSFQNKKTLDFINIYFGNNSITSSELLNILPIYDVDI
jgi:hypothetical protein